MNTAFIKNEEKQNRKQVGHRAYIAILIAILACALFMFVQTILAVVLATAFKEYLEDETIVLLLDIALSVFSFLLSFCPIHLIYKFALNKKKAFSVKRYIPKNPVLYIIGVIGICYLVNLVVYFLFSGFVEEYSVEIATPSANPLNIALNYVLIALIPAIFEEYSFRHVLLINLLPYGKWGAIICSSLLFGIVHVDPPRVIFASVFGFLLAVVREYTGSLIVPMIIHFINNAISLTMNYIPQDSHYMNLFVIMQYAFIIVGVVALIYYLRNGLGNHKTSIIKPKSFGYTLTFKKFFLRFVLNFGLLPLAFMYYLYFYSYYLA